MRKLIIIFCFVLGMLQTIDGLAQYTDKPLKVAVFAPVYLDSAFSNNIYKLGNNNLPKTVLPGLDFYNGINLAIDSLNAENLSLTVLFYDTKSNTQGIDDIIESAAMQDVSLIIASFNARIEMTELADFALSKNIPLISMTYPNDGGITGNPFFIMVNPTIKTHVEAIYKHLQKNYPTDRILYFKKSGAVEDMISNVFADLNKKTLGVPLKFKTIDIADSITAYASYSAMDSTRLNVVLCGSLNESFGSSLVRSVASNKNYRSVIYGMPTWDAIKDIGRDANIYFTSSYNYSRVDKLGQYINTAYRNKYAGRPSDMVHKGFESLYHFGKLLIQYKGDIFNHLSDNEFTLFNEFSFRPVKSKIDASIPDYLENKKIYFIRKVNGQIKSVN